MNPSDLRREYKAAALDEDSVDANPVAQFRLWFEQACSADLVEPNAMSLSTVDSEGRPNIRTVLLKAYDDRGFVFYTNYTGNKAEEISQNTNVALLFPWLPLERQVKILGRAEKVSTAESMKYFLSRPHGSRLGAWVSNQSKVISGRKVLEMKLEEIKRKFADGEIPLPDFWGGYRVVPRLIEFWQGRESRLHDRIQFEQTNDDQWSVSRLAP
ncbi:pyridoxamine 5'-phosphate oxidase [Rubellicoccus peritrichatus]|uniref:Pyridoxamine 5'-phosphate oxidase n=1 Tax=Rubellicoccus peritrichatus TaxID=3080537 RepID=A0AAQ3QX13_9BACT|nr:pyridoxamine 5'-phosphate oxidase [Puniceicoccus sp. CR14]WOO42420.1 pyridoxamine 5'-phosphate oxidase [Puniceicoccus sp. CR14]